MMFLNLSGQIEGQLREAYDQKFKAGLVTQTSLAKKLNVNRSAIHRRLQGHTNMTIETIADMVWGLDHAIKVEIFDPAVTRTNHFIGGQSQAVPPAPAPRAAQPNGGSVGPELQSVLNGVNASPALVVVR